MLDSRRVTFVTVLTVQSQYFEAANKVEFLKESVYVRHGAVGPLCR
jgi:hypothetical protein